MLVFQEPSKKKRLELPEKEKRQRDQVDKILEAPFFLLFFFLTSIVILVKCVEFWCVLPRNTE